MKMKLSFCDKSNYTWIESGNTIVCGIECKINNIHTYDIIRKMFPKIEVYYKCCVFKVYGVAKCSPEDSFDYNTGKHLAEARAKKKAYSIANRISSLVLENMELELDNVSNFEIEMFNQYQHELDHINYLIGN